MKLPIKTISVCAGVSVLLATAFAADGWRDRTKRQLDNFEPTGNIERCLNVRNIDSITALEDDVFLVRAGRTFYLNEPSRRCSGASDPFTYLQYEVSVGSLCRNEIIHVVDQSSGIRAGGCTLGDFQELQKVEKIDTTASMSSE